jgi:hypothetical protein
MDKYLFSLTLVFFTFFLQAKEKNELNVSSKVEKVTIYLKGAQVSRTALSKAIKGTNIIRFQSLSPYIEANSIQIRTDKRISLQSIKFERNFLSKDKVNKSVDSLQRLLLHLGDSVKIYNADLNIVNKSIELINSNISLGQRPSAEIKELSIFYEARLKSLIKEQLRLNDKISIFRKSIKDFENQVKEINGREKNKDVSGEIVIEFTSENSQDINFDFNYYLSQASWIPYYDVFASEINQAIETKFKANVRQDSGEDWSNIKLVLSSENPLREKQLPILNPYYIDHRGYINSYKTSFGTMNGRVINDSNEPLIGASILIEGTTIGTISDINGNFTLPIIAGDNQVIVSYVGYEDQILKLKNGPQVVTMSEAHLLEEVIVQAVDNDGSSPSIRGNRTNETTYFIDGMRLVGGVAGGVSVRKNMAGLQSKLINRISGFEYEIAGFTNINSGENGKIIDINSFEIDAEFEYAAIPKLSNDVYLKAVTKEWDSENLIDGEMNVYYANTYIGKSIFFANDADSLILSLGIDKDVKVKRLKGQNSSKKPFLASKKIEKREWLYFVQNNKNTMIKIDIIDQLPISNETNVEVIFEKSKGIIYDKINGQVTWPLNIEAKSKKEFTFLYEVKYSNDSLVFLQE